MCSNPLVLAMYVSNDQSSDATNTPDTRTAFYSQVVEELLVARRSRQLGLAARSTLREQREAILGRLAYQNLTDANRPPNSLSWREALEVVSDVYGCDHSDVAERYFRELARDTGIISEERERERVFALST